MANENKVYSTKEEVTPYVNVVSQTDSTTLKGIVSNVVQMIRDKHL
jgi:hypothetical protein